MASPVLHAIITRLGLPAVLVGSGVEGEPFALAGGLLAHRRIVPLWTAAAAAIVGAFGVDLLWFVVGRRFRSSRWVRAAAARPAFARSLAMIERHATLAILLFRFAYGLRAVAPVAVGVSRVPARRFVPTCLAAAVLWGTGYTLVGYWFGSVVGAWAGDLAIGGGLLGAGLLAGGVARLARADTRGAA